MRRFILAAAAGLPAAFAIPLAAPIAAPAAQQTTDLADAVAGRWQGAVTSDSRGSSRESVTVTITKVGPNQVEIGSDYDRLPSVRVSLTDAGNAILNARPGTTFLVERDRDPDRLDLHIDGAALIVRR